MHVPKLDQNGYMLDLFINREPGQKHVQEHLISTRQQWKHESDLIGLKRELTINLDFDFKRKPVNPCMVQLGNVPHLAFETVPWEKANDGLDARMLFDNWRKKRCLKNMDDFKAWNDFIILHSIKGKSVKLRSQSLVNLLHRLFIYAYANECWGCKRVMSYTKLAEWLSSKGYSTKKHHFTYARRSKTTKTLAEASRGCKAILDCLARNSARFGRFSILSRRSVGFIDCQCKHGGGQWLIVVSNFRCLAVKSWLSLLKPLSPVRSNIPTPK